jgi:uncharacterized caspase-like protein
VCEVLRKLDYEIPDVRVLVGNIKFDTLRRGINKFFPDKSTNSDDTQLFYFSGHGIPEGNGYYYLAASDLDPAAPYNEGYSFYELTAMME